VRKQHANLSMKQSITCKNGEM